MPDTETANNTQIETVAEPRPLIVVPHSSRELPPPAPASVYAQAEALWRDCYDEVVDEITSASGETVPPMHGSPKWAIIMATLKLKELCDANGYRALGALSMHDFARAIMFGFRRTTGHSLRAVEHQGLRLMIERRRELRYQQAAE